MHESVRRIRWYRMILLLLCCWMFLEAVVRASEDDSISKATIPVDPAAATVFPSAQLSSACGIVAIEGLGPLDGDYTLVDELMETNGILAWIGTSVDTQNFLLSWQMHERVWTIGKYGLSVYRAFVEGDPDVPPSTSSRWQMYNRSVSVFEEVDHAVSITCPACAAVTISMLPGTLATCEGPYRLRTVNNNAGIFTWLHVSDERCEMVHDKAGHSLVTFVNKPIAMGGSGTVYGVLGGEDWLLHGMGEGVAAPAGGGAEVVCTSAGRTTRLGFYAVEPRARVNSPQAKHDGSDDAQSLLPSSHNVKLVSPQDGSIISATHGNIHVRISRDEKLRQRDGHETDVSGMHIDDDNACGSKLCVKTTVDGEKWLTTSLERMSIRGGLLTLRDLEGTNVFEVCLYEQDTGETGESRVDKRQGCIARAVLRLEMFSAETQMVQRRSSSQTALTPGVMSSGVGVDKPIVEGTRVVFLVDLGVVDGFKLSTLHLMKHLPDTFRASALDLSCESGNLPMKEIFAKEVGEVERFCVEISKEAWDRAERESGSMSYFLHLILSNAATWEDVVIDYPDVAQALGKLYQHLTLFDALVMSNGGLDNDAYILHLARLAGVKTRMMNLGAITGGYMSPMFSAATSLVGPSHYVAHNPAVVLNAGGLPIKVCHPVMDAARVLKAARSCGGNLFGGLNQSMGPTRGITGALEFPLVATGGSGGSLQPATFIMVSKLEVYKTPGMFVRAMAILQRRRRADGKQGKHATQGVIVGSGRLRDHMESLARDLNATISFKGFLSVDDVPCEVQRATALVVPSISPETFGMVGPEAMLLGLPVVTFGFGGTGELVRHMENGMVVAEPTPRALADALEVLANDSELRDRLGVQARLDATWALSLPEIVACHADALRTE